LSFEEDIVLGSKEARYKLLLEHYTIKGGRASDVATLASAVGCCSLEIVAAAPAAGSAGVEIDSSPPSINSKRLFAGVVEFSYWGRRVFAVPVVEALEAKQATQKNGLRGIQRRGWSLREQQQRCWWLLGDCAGTATQQQQDDDDEAEEEQCCEQQDPPATSDAGRSGDGNSGGS
jgi:hypothetical protein